MFPEEERADVIRRAEDRGVGRILVPATGPSDLDAVVALAEEFADRVVVALGFHPHDAQAFDTSWKRRLESALDRAPVVAIGEIGLDYHYLNSPAEDQRRALAWQLALALDRDLPVVLHHREAWNDFLVCLDEHPGVRGVAHSFTEGAEGAIAVTSRGLFVGISGMATFPRGDNVREAARATPRGMLLVETDSPYLAPVPHRGSRNEPCRVPLVAAAVARVRDVGIEALEQETDDAFAALFTR
jgi:TatD DNase family protein